MRNVLLVPLLAALLGGQGAHPAARRDPRPVPEPEEYAVYAVLLKRMFMGEGAERLVIDKYTAVSSFTGGDPGRVRRLLAPMAEETADDFKSKNGLPTELSDKFGLKVTVTFIDEDELGRIFQRRGENYDGWKAFRQKYPGAGEIITLSRVGFNPDKTQAVVYVGYQCDWLCGEGNYVLLTKKDGAWKVEKKAMIWIS